jgi:hypothetical protein
MTINIVKKDLVLLYTSATESYYKCIRYSGNAFLEQEISVPLETVGLVNSNVKIVFSHEDIKEYQLEVTLKLLDKSDQSIGKYVYVEDHEGNAIDDSLVFF